jgi:predicted KAP-like P-loop ATPase
LNRLFLPYDQRRGTSHAGESSSKNLEFSMQTVVDRVRRAFTPKHPISNEEAEAIRREANEFAIDLLAKYKSKLEHRTLSGTARR